MLTASLIVALLQAAPVAVPSPAPEPARERQICRRNELNTGSLVSAGRTCHTAAEWRAIDAENSRGVNGFHDNMSGSATRMGRPG